MAKSGHSFPARQGFTSSTGKTQSVKGYTRAVPKKAIGGFMPAPAGVAGPSRVLPAPPAKMPMQPMSSPKTPPMQIRQAPIMRQAAPFPRSVQPVRGRGTLAYADGGFVKEGDGTMKTETIGDQGNAVVKRGKPAYTEADAEYGGTSPLRTGYKKGGSIKKKGSPTFNKAPLFGKK